MMRRYPGTEKNTLEDISLFCTLNSRVAVLGPNGAGKSTMIKVCANAALVRRGKALQWCAACCAHLAAGLG